jgi:phosphoenolpyruvate synthase/pyruvate phosphate dikinase
MSQFTRCFDQIGSQDGNLVGGKGASLGEMTQAGFDVPNGFVITTEAFVVLGTTPLDALPEAFVNEVYDQFDKIGAEFVAVRSSANCEDSVDNSFAGQFETYLNITREHLLENIVKCWESVYGERSQAYIEEKQIDKNSVQMAVVIQQMIQSEVAGVAFCCHPVSGDQDQIFIEGGYGLGEAVVSGQITPDSYIVDKTKNTILETHISTQTRGLFKDHTGANIWKTIRPNLSQQQKLSDQQVLELAQICRNIERHYGFVCDIEWALCDNRFYITQSRPVTTFVDQSMGNSSVYNRAKSVNWIKWLERPNPPFFGTSVWTGLGPDEFIKAGFGDIGYHFLYQDGMMYYDVDNAQVNFTKVQNLLYSKSLFWMSERLQQTHDDNIAIVQHLSHSDQTILDKLRGFYTVIRSYGPFLFITISLEQIYEHRGEEQLREHADKLTGGDVQSLIVLLAKSDKKTVYDKINDDIRNRKPVTEIHAQYAWSKSRDGFTDFYTLEEIQDIVDNFDQTRADSFDIPEGLEGLAREYGELIFFRTDRTDKLYEMLGLFRPILIEIAEHFGLTFAELAQYNCVDLIKGEMNKYNKDFSYTFVDGGHHIQNHHIVLFETVQVDVLSGNTAYPGKVTGVVKVIKHPSEISKVHVGDVLVAQMTLPSFIMAMNKACAFVTDEGGITCHASIVAREMKKPCVIGTKIATQVLKDGDLVEVDADHGIVRKLEKHTYTAKRSRHGILPSPAYWNLESESRVTCSGKLDLGFSELLSSIDAETKYQGFWPKGEFKDCSRRVFEYILNNEKFVIDAYTNQTRLGTKIIQKYNDFDTLRASMQTTPLHSLYTKIAALKKLWIEYDQSNVLVWLLGGDSLSEYLLAELSGVPTTDFQLLTTPIDLSNSSKEELEILQLAFGYKITKKIDHQGVQRIYNDYCFSAFGHNGPTIKTIQYYTKQVIQTSKEYTKKVLILKITQLENYTLELKKSQSLLIKKYSISESVFRLLSDLSMMATMQDDRKIHHFRLHLVYSIYLERVAQLKKVDLIDLYYLTVEEIKNFSRDQIIDTAEKRKRGVFSVTVAGATRMIASDELEYQKYLEATNTGGVAEANITTISGSSASTGIVTGKVSIIRASSDMGRFIPGNILVSGMTSPEFLPVMKNSIAIITDEGGVTCHAAIISRELGIPCIIGTKIATQALKDGDLVEVDADHGVVRILESTSDIDYITKYSLDSFTWTNKGFHGVLHTFFPVAQNAISMIDFFGEGCERTLFYIKDNYANWYWNDNDLTRIREKFFKRLEQDDHYLEQLKIQWSKKIGVFDKIIKKIDKTELRKQTDADLVRMYNQFYDAYLDQFKYFMALGDAVSMHADRYLVPEFKKNILDDFDIVFAKLLTTRHVSFLEEEAISRNALTEHYQRTGKIPKTELSRHARNFFYIHNNYAKGDRLTVKDFEDMIIQSVNAKTKVVVHDKLHEQNEKILLIQKYSLNEYQQKLLYVMDEFFGIQDTRKKYVLISNYYQFEFLRELSRRTGVEMQLLYNSIQPEFESILKGVFDTDILKKRCEGSLYLQLKDTFEIVTGDHVQQVADYFSKSVDTVSEIKGMTAAKGNVRGRVKKILKIHDIVNMERGDILVSSMTRPEMVPAMKLSSAIITDEGGVTCHAAIISRELGIPCIIGTKIATQALKDGDLVEVDADHGVVRILERGMVVLDTKMSVVEDEWEFVWCSGPILPTYLGGSMAITERKDMGFGIGIFSYYDGEKITTYKLKSQLLEYNIQGEIYLDQKYFESYKKKYEEEKSNWWSWIRGVEKYDYTTRSDDETLSDYLKFIEYQRDAIAYFDKTRPEHTFAVEQRLERLIHQLHGDSWPTILGDLTTPVNLDDIQYEYVDWLILADKKQITDYDLLLHTSKYPWLVFGEFDDTKVLSFLSERLLNEDTKNNSAKIEVDRLTREKKHLQKQQAKLFKTFKENAQEVQYLAEFLQYQAIERMNIKSFWIGSYYIVRSMWARISRDFDISIVDLMSFVTPQDVSDLYVGDQYDEIIKCVDDRKISHAILVSKDGTVEMVGSQRAKIEYESRIKKIEHRGDTIHGKAAMLGHSVGKVRKVVIGNLDMLKESIRDFKDGEILVTTMTQPNMMVLAKRAKAIITAEGGITSHAAIISRELKVPCIVGCHHVMEILKDGDLVDVDADHGVVRILESASSNPLYDTKDFITLFSGKDMPLLLSDLFLVKYSKMGALSMQSNGIWITYLPKSTQKICLIEGSNLYTNEISYQEYANSFRKYMYDAANGLTSILTKDTLIADDVSCFFNLASDFWDYYPKTEFFYTDDIDLDAMIPSITDFDRLKLDGRKFLNTLSFETNGFISQLIRKLSLQMKCESENLFNYRICDLVSLVSDYVQLQDTDFIERKSYFSDGSIDIFGNDAQVRATVFMADYISATNTIYGKVAYCGIVRGYVKILNPDYTKFDEIRLAIDDMRHGDVLVAQSTSPEIMPAIKKAAAIITNQGGILSHAAIIARECKIPCIIGTNKDVTQALKDGDLVEVDADHGVVRIIKRNENNSELSFENFVYEFQQRNQQPVLMGDIWSRSMLGSLKTEIKLPIDNNIDYVFSSDNKAWVDENQKNSILDLIKKASQDKNYYDYIFAQFYIRLDELNIKVNKAIGTLDFLTNSQIADLWEER